MADFKYEIVEHIGTLSESAKGWTKGEKVSMNILEKICDELDCDIGDIIRYEK